MRILSLGWGVQSFTLAAMAALGEIEPVDAAIHADTTHERSGTYKFAKAWTPWLEERGVKVATVEANSTEQVWQGKMIPAFTYKPAFTMEHDGWVEEEDENGDMVSVYYPDFVGKLIAVSSSNGQALRTCTQRWKIAPIRKWLQANRNGAPVELLLGISLDEALRMKPSDVKYITHQWPLIDKRMTRHDCARWLEAHNLEVPPKSSCTFCPYHNSAAWAELKQAGGKDWREALDVDRAIRKARPPYDLFVHPARIPLELVDLRTAEERGQLSLWDDECSGVCGV